MNVHEPDRQNSRCSVEITSTLAGGKWQGLVVSRLCQKSLRFSQPRRRMTGIAQKMLTQQLRELEGDGLVRREAYAEVPSKVGSSLADKDRNLASPLKILCRWGQDYAAR